MTALPRLAVVPSLATELAGVRQARADFHGLIGALLLRAPGGGLWQALTRAPALPGCETAPLPRAWLRLRRAVVALSPEQVAQEQRLLFAAPGRSAGPCASRYLGGAARARAQARLRDDLRALGLTRRSGVPQSEDHLGLLCEAMRLLIAGAPGLAPRPMPVQQGFFEQHIEPWYARALDDLRRADGANFYIAVADFAEAFLDFERDAFAWADAPAAFEWRGRPVATASLH